MSSNLPIPSLNWEHNNSITPISTTEFPPYALYRTIFLVKPINHKIACLPSLYEIMDELLISPN